MSLYPCRKPPQTLTFPLCQALLVERTLPFLLDLQSLWGKPFTLNLGGEGDVETLEITLLQKDGKTLHLYPGTILVKHDDLTFETFPSLDDFLLVYQLEPS